MDYSSPGSFVHGILRARILEWAAISFSSFRIISLLLLTLNLNRYNYVQSWEQRQKVSMESSKKQKQHNKTWERKKVQRFRNFSRHVNNFAGARKILEDITGHLKQNWRTWMYGRGETEEIRKNFSHCWAWVMGTYINFQVFIAKFFFN